MPRLPSIYIPHGGGPSFFMTGDRKASFQATEDFLRNIQDHLPAKPKAILIITAHWETRIPSFTGGLNPELIYDYYGFPPETYTLKYAAPGLPALAKRAADLIQQTGLPALVDDDYGWDHGVFIPLKVMFPAAEIPVVAMSLHESLNPELHSQLGRALSPLRDEGVLIIGSGFLTHGLRYLRDWRIDAVAPTWSSEFDQWAAAALASADFDTLANFKELAPGMPYAHPTVEHFTPLFVALGTGDHKAPQTLIEGYFMGLSKRSVLVS